jgi:hypothetical protein
MADGNISQYKALKGTKESEFYTLMDLHKKKLERLKNLYNARRK